MLGKTTESYKDDRYFHFTWVGIFTTFINVFLRQLYNVSLLPLKHLMVY